MSNQASSSNSRPPLRGMTGSSNPTVMSTLEGRTLVLCFDGTSNHYGDGNTNVIRLFQGLDKMNDKQICYYQPGIGTYVSPTKPLGQVSRRVSKVVDMAVALYLDDHIMGGYNFLMENYQPGDRICLFGFSRGAYIARCLAGMMHIVGLLPKGNAEQIPFAYALYKDDSNKGVTQAHGFKHTFSRHIGIDFLGVWDSVTSVGLAGRTLPFTSHNAVVKTFRQALALDERRAKFRHNPWFRPATDVQANERQGPAPEKIPNPNPDDLEQSGDVDFFDEGTTFWAHFKQAARWRQQVDQAYYWEESSDSHSDSETPSPALPEVEKGLFGRVRDRFKPVTRLRKTVDNPEYGHKQDESGPRLLECPHCDYKRKGAETNCREVWFAGAHSDVGGGSEPDSGKKGPRPNISNPSLLWMIQQIELAHVGIIWAEDAFENVPAVHLYLNHPEPLRRQLTTEILDSLRQDVAKPIHDKLRKPWSIWWSLEWIPLWKQFLNKNSERCKELCFNRGRRREIQQAKPLVHVSVQMRTEAVRGYAPRALTDQHKPRYVMW